MRHANETILLATPDEERQTARHLQERGYRVLAAATGVEALQLTVSRHPDLILFDEACPLLDADAFLRIVRSNPRTAQTPILVASADPAPGQVAKPLEPRALLGAIESALAAARASGQEEEETRTEGSLDPLSLADLLQALHLQGRSGKLVLHFGGREGAIWLQDGSIHDAKLGQLEGKKALLRLLSVGEGRWELHPPGELRQPRIPDRVEFLLLEAARQEDELARVLSRLPAGERLVAAVDPERIPSDAPLHGALLRMMWGEPKTVQELLDSSEASDPDLALAIDELLRTGWAQVAPGGKRDPEPLVYREVAHRLRRRLPTPSHRGQVAGKLLLLGEDEGSLQRLLRGLSAREGVQRVEAGPGSPWGTVASIALGEGVTLDLVALPSAEEMAPLALFLASGALGALSAGAADTWGWLGSRRGCPVVEADLADPIPALRTLLATLGAG